MPAIADLTLKKDGAVRINRAALSLVSQIEAIIAPVSSGAPGVRLYNVPGLAGLLDGTGPIAAVACAHAGQGVLPVRAVLFNKTAASNWALGFHQDRTIAVAEKIDVTGFGPWTVKAGTVHVEPPFSVIERMITLRIHLDPVPADNAPLLIAPGSHLLGRIAEASIAAVVERCGTMKCEADRGDVWAYATPILHASASATQRTNRRVLQVDYAPDSLPGGLEWAGI